MTSGGGLQRRRLADGPVPRRPHGGLDPIGLGDGSGVRGGGRLGDPVALGLVLNTACSGGDAG